MQYPLNQQSNESYAQNTSSDSNQEETQGKGSNNGNGKYKETDLQENWS